MLMYIKPYFPYIDYFFHKEYIVQNLCENKDKPELKCHGKCHLEKEIKKTVKEEREDPILPSPENEKENKQLNLFVETEHKLLYSLSSEKQGFLYEEMTSSFTRRFIVPPPKFIC